MTTPILGLPEMLPNDPNKFLSHNLALRYLEALCAGGAIDVVNDPPVSPTDGDLYIVGQTPTGVFVGEDNNLAYFDSSWIFIPPATGVTTILTADKRQIFWDGSNWLNLNDLPYETSSTEPTTGELNKFYGLTSAVSNFTMPAGVNDGDQVIIADYDGNFSTTPLTITPSGGDTVTPATLSQNYAVTKFMFANGTWRQVGVADSITGGSGGSSFPAGTPLTIYVANITGSDLNTGITAGSPFKTLPKAVELMNNLDLDQFDATILLVEDYTAFDSDIVYLGDISTAGGVPSIAGDVSTRTITFDSSYSTSSINPEDPALLNFVNGGFWLISNLNFDSSNVGAVRNACIRVKDRSTLRLSNNIGFFRGSTAGTECIGCFNKSFVSQFTGSLVITVEGTTANPIYYFLRSEDDACVLQNGGSHVINPNFPGDLNVIASGGAYVFAKSAYVFCIAGSPANNVNGAGSFVESINNSFVQVLNPPGTTMANIQSTESIIL